MTDLAFLEPTAVLDDGAPFVEELPGFDPIPGPFPAERLRGISLPRRRSRPSRRADAAPSELLPSEPALFPWLARRLAPGEATVWTGAPAALEPILELVYAGNARAGHRISLVEGANRFHPYRIGELGRAFGVDATDTLRRIRLARAFTAYQLVALVDGWAAELRRHPADLVIGHDLPALFANDEILPEERTELLRHVARTLAGLAREVRAPILLTLGPRGSAEFPGLPEEGPPWCDFVTFARGPGTVRARALRSDARLALVPRPAGQHGIEEYGGGSPGEVVAWDVPPRRIGRRSRSG